MKISSREKGLIVILIFVAIIVFLMPGDENISFEKKSTLNKTVTKILIAKYKYIRPFDFYENGKKNGAEFILKRNIFQYGIKPNEYDNQIQIYETPDKTSKNDSDNNQKKEEEGESIPPIDFKILGIIKVENGVKAIVVTKGPELFVFREGDKMFDKFVLKKIEGFKIIVGFKGFDETKTINLENKGGF